MYKNLMAAACGLLIPLLFPHSLAWSAPPLKAAFVYVAPLTETGWVRQHESGRQAIEQQLKTRETHTKDSFLIHVQKHMQLHKALRVQELVRLSLKCKNQKYL